MAPRDAATLPSFQINDNPVLSRFPTFATKNGSSPTPDDTWPDNPSLPHVGPLRVDAETPSLARCMEKRLRQNMVALPNSKSSRNKFWPGKLFDHLFQQSDVLQLVGELKRQGWLGTVDEKSLQDWAKKVGQRYRRVFALLILTGAEAYLLDFVKASIDDSRLPLDRDAADLGQILGTYRDLDSICVMYQWQLVVDFFELAPPGDVYQVRLHEESIRPWCQHQVKRSREETRHGSYGEVRQIKIHPWQHNFGPTLEKLAAKPNVFALKTLTSEKAEETFHNEADMLGKFGGDGIQNVRLLAKIIEPFPGGAVKYSLLFPWAEQDLDQYLNSTEMANPETEILWLAEQCHGLAVALRFIHNPPHLKNEQGKALFGRHGDIKPENILWFKNDKRQLLAFADMGLTKVHKDSSRSNIPGKDIPRTPHYRPPECDMEGNQGHISRSFDIWTLGCVFLELVVWILEGPTGVQDFKRQRKKPYLTDLYETCLFFSLQKVPESKTEYAFQVQDSVTERIEQLHANKACTAYLHDFLDIIQGDMLIVQSNSVERIRASRLDGKLEKLKIRCKTDKAYYTMPHKGESSVKPLPPVRAAINSTAQSMLDSMILRGKMSDLSVYEGETRYTTTATKDPNI